MSNGGSSAARSEGERITALERDLSSIGGDVRELTAAVRILSDKVGDSGKTNWPMVLAAIGVLGSLIVLYGAPLKTDLDGIKAQQTVVAQQSQLEVRRIEDDRRRDQDKFDERLQREMRLLTDVVATNAAATKEMFNGRLAIDEQRINDVTGRVDSWNVDERRELHGIWNSRFNAPQSAPTH